MSIVRSHLAHLGGMLALALVLSWAWLSWTDCVAAQLPGGSIQPDKPLQPPKLEIPPADLAIMKALDSPIQVELNGLPLVKVFEYLEEHSKGALPIVVDESGLKEAHFEIPQLLNDPVTKHIRSPIQVRALLKMILSPRGVGYYIEDGVVYITKDTKANSRLIVRSYPVSNLVGGQVLVNAAIHELTNGGKMGPFCQTLSQNVDGLIAEVMGTVEPDSWRPPMGNGPGAMTFVPNTASLQIRASREIHYLLMASGMLDKSRPVAAGTPSEKDLRTVTIKVYSIAGLLDPKNLERSKAELQNALNLLVVTGDMDKSSIVFLTHPELLVVRQSLEIQLQIEQMLLAMRGMRNVTGAGPMGPAQLPANLSGIHFGMQGGGGLFGTMPGLFASPASPHGGDFLGMPK